MKFHIWTIGCQMNEADSRRLSEALEAAGHSACPAAGEADLLILNTCVVRQSAEDRARARLAEVLAWKRRHPGVKIALMGCLVGHRPATRRPVEEEWAGVDFFLPPSDPRPLLEALAGSDDDSAGRNAERRLRLERESAMAGRPSPGATPVSANVPVVLGCSRACTYCVIPYRRGRERSRPPAEVLEEVRSLVAQGAREVVLLGQIVDRYGQDLPDRPTLAGLLRQAARIDGLRRIRFLTNHPAFLDDDLLNAIADEPRICPHFEIPAQAGNDEVLRRMRRGYTASEYRAVIERIRRRLPECAIHSDFIVGFPGETEAAFEETVRLLQDLRFDKVHIARYSPRPETLAARRWPDEVSEEEKERRRARLETVQRHIQSELNARFLGRVVEVLVDGRDERRNRWRGRTSLDRIVFFSDIRPRLGDLAQVRIVWTGPYSLIGEPVGAPEV